MILVRDVSFRYETTPVLIDVSFPIHPGDFLAIIGPNGSGKTTLVKVILGLLKPESGSVEIFGQPLEQFEDWGKIGYVPQKATHFDPFFPASVEEVVEMALLSGQKFLSRRRRVLKPRAVGQALRQVGMEEFRTSPIGRLSGGQQQRAFIARSLVTKPQILFLDEPTTGVDAETQRRFYDMLDRLNRREGLTIVLVTHDIGIINRHVNKVACLNQRLVYHGTHDEFCRSEAFKDMVSRGDHLVSHEH